MHIQQLRPPISYPYTFNPALQWRPVLVAWVVPVFPIQGFASEEHGQPHVIQTGLHAASQSHTIRQLLDFPESAPSLISVDLVFATPGSGAQKWTIGVTGMSGGVDHLRILPALPVIRTPFDPGRRDDENRRAELRIHLPETFNNLNNLSNLTKARLDFRNDIATMEFAGPNGRPGLLTYPCLRGEPLSGDLHQILRSMEICGS